VEQAARRLITALVVAALLAFGPPGGAQANGDLPLTGALGVTPAGDAIMVTLEYRAEGVIHSIEVRLTGPNVDEVLYQATPLQAHVSWSDLREGLVPGTYTVTLRAEVAGPGGVRSGSESRTVVLDGAGAAGQPPPEEPDLDAAPEAEGPSSTSIERQTDAAVEGDGSVSAALSTVSTDVVVYGGTPSGVIAAVSAARNGARVALIEPLPVIGGMMGNGLTATDYGHPVTIGGYTKEFFDRTQAIEGSAYGRWRFQPSTARRVFSQMLSQSGVSVYLNEALLETGGVVMDGTRITAILTSADRAFIGRTFIDATYEGDLMARAGVSYRVGREAPTEYGESFAGVRGTSAVFTVPAGIDPYFPVATPGPVGSGDDRIQNSNYRLCFSTAGDRVPFRMPAGYSPGHYDIAAAYLAWRVGRGETPDITWFLWPVLLTNNKYDVNNNGPVSIGVFGLTTKYPDATYADRADTEAWLKSYTQGFLYFLRNDARVPQRIRDQMATYGLCRDEWAANGNWPYRFYLREGRRMVGQYVLHERDVVLQRTKTDTIAIASYAFDSHHVSRWIDGSNRLALEGGFWNGRAAATRWSIPYRSLTPRPAEVTNLLVSVSVSTTHVALASLRMEPQYMLMGEAAGVAAALAARGLGVDDSNPMAVQSLNPATIRTILRQQGAIIDNYLFWDVVDNPFRGDIEVTHLAGVTFGCSPILFCPKSNLTREVMAAFLARALDLPPASRDYFTDDSTSPYEDEINRVAEAGVTAGCGGGRFCPTATVSRGQMAAFLVRAFRLPHTNRDFFTDDSDSMFQGDINRLAASGITGGCGGTRFCPDGLVTREQIAAFLRRAMN
jgi:hypothetical protein